jgi:hypothetical protein
MASGFTSASNFPPSTTNRTTPGFIFLNSPLRKNYVLDANDFLPIFNYDKYITLQGEREYSSSSVRSSRQISPGYTPD